MVRKREEEVRIKEEGGKEKLIAHSYRHSRGSGNPELIVRKCHCEERSDAAISYEKINL